MLMRSEVSTMSVPIVILLLSVLRMRLMLLALDWSWGVHLHAILLVSMSAVHKDIVALLLSLIVHLYVVRN